MTDTPSEYYMKRAREEVSNVALMFTTWDAIEAFASYIAKHEPEPELVDPDLVLVSDLLEAHRWDDGEKSPAYDVTLAALKKGREQSGLQWIKHDGSDVCPVDDGAFCAVRFANGDYAADTYPIGWSWREITHYAVINLPEIDQ